MSIYCDIKPYYNNWLDLNYVIAKYNDIIFHGLIYKILIFNINENLKLYFKFY
jgi:hypothetical protein